MSEEEAVKLNWDLRLLFREHAKRKNTNRVSDCLALRN